MKPQETTVFILKIPLSLPLLTPLTAHIFLRSFKCSPSLLHFQNIAWLLEKHPTSSAALHLVPYMVSA